MEKVLDIYKRPYDQRFPVICMDESPRQLIDEVKMPVPGAPGRPARYDYEYKRHGVCNVFMSNEPLAGKRMVKVTERKTKQDWALFIAEIAQCYSDAEKITLVMDNLNTHKPDLIRGVSSKTRRRNCGTVLILFTRPNTAAG